MSAPWSFEEATANCRAAAVTQQQAENTLRDAYRDFARKEESYRVALAKEIVRQHAEEGVAWTVAPDLARGDTTVARLRMERDVAEGVKEAMQQAVSDDFDYVGRIARHALWALGERPCPYRSCD